MVSSKEVLVPYFQALGGKFYIIGVAFFAILAYSLMAANDLWLAGWVSDIESLSQDANMSRAIGYIGLSLSQFTGVLLLSSFNSFATTRAGRVIHDKPLTICFMPLCLGLNPHHQEEY